MPTLTQEDVFTFDQLSESAKDHAREGERENTDFDPCYESFLTAAGILGISFATNGRREPDIRWSGFSSQGDGASFVGYYNHEPNSPAKVRESYPADTALHAIADGFTAIQCAHRLLTGHYLTARITQSDNHYVHKYTMAVEYVTDTETGEEVDDPGIDDRILDLMRDFAQWIYDGLQDEYDYRLSDEAIDESLSDAEFDEGREQV